MTDEIDDQDLFDGLTENHEMLPRPGKPQILAQVIGKDGSAGLMRHMFRGHCHALRRQTVKIELPLFLAVAVAFVVADLAETARGSGRQLEIAGFQSAFRSASMIRRVTSSPGPSAICPLLNCSTPSSTPAVAYSRITSARASWVRAARSAGEVLWKRSEFTSPATKSDCCSVSTTFRLTIAFTND